MTQGRPSDPDDPGATVPRPDVPLPPAYVETPPDSSDPPAEPDAAGDRSDTDEPAAPDPGTPRATEPVEESAPAPAPATPSRQTSRTSKADDPLRGSRASGFWAAIVALGLVLVLLVIFIVQNTQPVDVEFLALDVEAPLSAALLVAAAAGILLAAIGGTLRIWQLRRRVKRTR